MGEASWIVSLTPNLSQWLMLLTSNHLLAEVGPGLSLLVRLLKTERVRVQKGRLSPQLQPP